MVEDKNKLITLNKFYYIQKNIFFLQNLKNQTNFDNNKVLNICQTPNVVFATKMAYLFFLNKSNVIFFPKSHLKYLLHDPNSVEKISLIQIKKIVRYFFKKTRNFLKKCNRFEKKYFFKKKLIFFHSKKKLRKLIKRKRFIYQYGRKKRQLFHHSKNKNNIKYFVKQKLKIFQLILKKRAKRKVLKKRKYFLNTGILHYVVTKRNVKITVTNIKHDVLGYFSSGSKQFRKSKRRKLAAKKAINRKVLYFMRQKKFRKIFIIIHGRIRSIGFLKRQYRKRKIRIIARIHNRLRPHNGCRKKKR
jgi:small subunit ribosomal protein S11